MSPIELAKIYMKSFSGEKPFEEMKSVVTEDLQFAGPFYKYDTADDYIESLEEQEVPIGGQAYEILEELENENSCCLVYKTKKQGLDEIMAQLFEVNDNKITKIRLILDASKFLKKK